MVFSSSLFLLYFFPIFLVLYHLADKKYKNWIILFASIFFYSWGAPKFVFIVVGSVFTDFYIIKALHNSGNDKSRKQLLALSLSINIGLLLFFKYANFFVDNVNSVLNSFGVTQVKWTEVALPIGISFYTFQTLTYSIDVYKRVRAPFRNARDYMVYIMLFPQMIAGPIVRFNMIADQIENREQYETIENKLNGLLRFIKGLAKKVLIANVLGQHVDIIFAASVNDLSTLTVWIGILAYAFQILFDFSGYSDMAIGIGRILGFKFPENFNNPYVSKSISEFWRRWHITLGEFMKDYLYIPLGGNKCSRRRLFFNLWLVFLISGLWHGAAWNFVIWGAFHGLFLIIDRLFLLKVLNRVGAVPSMLLTFFITLIGWVFFRTENIEGAWLYICKMFEFTRGTNYIHFDPKFWTLFVLAILFSFFTIFKTGLKIEKYFKKFNFSNSAYVLYSFLALVSLYFSVASIISSGFNPFIYFRF